MSSLRSWFERNHHEAEQFSKNTLIIVDTVPIAILPIPRDEIEREIPCALLESSVAGRNKFQR